MSSLLGLLNCRPVKGPSQVPDATLHFLAVLKVTCVVDSAIKTSCRVSWQSPSASTPPAPLVAIVVGDVGGDRSLTRKYERRLVDSFHQVLSRYVSLDAVGVPYVAPQAIFDFDRGGDLDHLRTIRPSLDLVFHVACAPDVDSIPVGVAHIIDLPGFLRRGRRLRRRRDHRLGDGVSAGSVVGRCGGSCIGRLGELDDGLAWR